jgi:hypothetical protein
MIPFIGLMLFLFDKNWKNKIKGYKFWIPWLVCGIFFISVFVQNVENYKFEIHAATQYDGVGESFRYSELKLNAMKYSKEMINGKLHPLILNLFIIIGIFYFFRSPRPSFFMLTWFFVFFIVYMPSAYGVFPYYLLPSYLGVIFLGSFGGSEILKRCENSKYKSTLSLSLVIILLISFFPYVKDVYSKNPEIATLETQIPELAEREIPENCYIITKFPTILMATTNLKCIMTEHVIQEPEIITGTLNNTNCVLYFEDYFSLFMYEEENKIIHDKYYLTPLLVYKSDGGDVKYTFYRIEFKKENNL